MKKEEGGEAERVQDRRRATVERFFVHLNDHF